MGQKWASYLYESVIAMIGKILSGPQDDLLPASARHQLDTDGKSIPAELPRETHRSPTRSVSRRGELGNLFEIRNDFLVRLGR